MITGGVERFEIPNLHALNFLLHGALDGGGTLSLKTDAQGKVVSTALLRLVLDVPNDMVERLELPPSGHDRCMSPSGPPSSWWGPWCSPTAYGPTHRWSGGWPLRCLGVAFLLRFVDPARRR